MESHNEDISDADATEFDDILTVFHASPLVSIDADGEVTPLDLPFVGNREYHYFDLHQDVKTRIRLDHRACTQHRFQEFLETQEGRVLHFACLASKDVIFLERDEKGLAHFVPLSEFEEWIQKAKHLELVMVANEAPETLVQMFVQAGVPHVVSCPVMKHKLDEAALVFCKTFYKALANSQTIDEAYNLAIKTVNASTHLPYTNGRQDTEQYQLLGENHDVVLFHKDKRKVQNLRLPPIRILPAAPSVFVGRQKEVHQLLEDLNSARLVRITGESGIGAASMVKSACQFMIHRREDYDHEIVWLPPRILGNMDGLTSLCLRIFQSVVNLESILQDDLVSLTNILKTHNVLLVCDIRKWESKEVFDAVMDFLDEIFDVAPTTRGILIQEAIDLGHSTIQLQSNYIEKSMHIKPLGYASTVTLFGLLCPFVPQRSVKSISSVEGLKKLLVPSAGYVGNVNLKSTIVKIYNLLGSGSPHRIRDIALSMTREEYGDLIQVGNLRQKLSRLYQRQIELVFPTRYSLDIHLAEISEAIEDARKSGDMHDFQMFEARYLEDSRRRNDLPSVDTMLVKLKVAKTDMKLAKLSGRLEEAERLSIQMTKLVRGINKEREAMIEDDEDWVRLNYIDHPHGISRRSLDQRYLDKEHLLIDARKTKDYHLERELEYPLKELRDCVSMLLTLDEWKDRLSEVCLELKRAETEGDIDQILKLNEQESEIESRVEDEQGDVNTVRIADDLHLPLDTLLRCTGDECVKDLPPFEELDSRAEIDRCLAKIKLRAETSSSNLASDRYSILVGLYKELCALIDTKFPTIECLLIQRQGLKLEEKVVFSDDKEILDGYSYEIKSIEARVRHERKALGADPFHGVSERFYLGGITRALTDDRIQELEKALAQAEDEGNVLESAGLEAKVAELIKQREKLPSAVELKILIERAEQDMEQLSSQTGREKKKELMSVAIKDLRKRKDAEEMILKRRPADIAAELLMSDQDYFFPPAVDSISQLNFEDDDEDDQSIDGSTEDKDVMSTVDEGSNEGSVASTD